MFFFSRLHYIMIVFRFQSNLFLTEEKMRYIMKKEYGTK